MSTPLTTTAILSAGMPRETRSVLNDLVSATTLAARRYRNSSSRSIIRNPKFSRIAPTAVMEAGHRSDNSNTNGRRLTAASAQPPTAAKNCGEVATTTSGRCCARPPKNAVNMKDRKSAVRSTIPSLAAIKVLTLTTRMPSRSSTWYQRLR